MLPERYPELDPDHVKVILLEMTDKVLAPFDPKPRAYAAEQLRARGVELRLGTAVAEVGVDRVVLKDGSELPAQMTIWATGVAAHDVVKKWGLTQGRGGRIVTGRDLRVPEHPDIFVAGDIGVIDEDPLPQLAQPAIQTGAHAAKNLLAVLEGRPPSTFKYFDKGTMATIGRRSAVAEIAHGPRLTGTLAWLTWMFVHIFALLGNRNRIMVSLALVFRYVGQRRAQLVVGD
jgi:NADH dehydrogenase